MLGFLKKSKARSGGVVGVAFSGEGAAVVQLRPPRRDDAPAIGACTYFHRDATAADGVLRDWVEDQRLVGVPAVGVLAPGEYQVVQVEAPAVPANEMRQAASWRVRELIDFPLDQAVIDTYDLPEAGQRGEKKINVVVARRAMVAERIELLRESGLELTAIDIPELVQRNVCTYLPTTRSGHALLALEHGSGLLTIFRDGEQLLARSLETGHGDLQREDRAPIDSLVLEVQRSFDYFESALQQPSPGMLHVYPGGDHTADLLEALQGNLETVDCQPVMLSDLVAVTDEPEHVGATTLHALGAGLRDRVARA